MDRLRGCFKGCANKIINAQCVVENLVANTIGLTYWRNFCGNDAILGGISSLTGQITSLAGDVLGIITDVLSFLSCEEKPVCPGVNNWVFLVVPHHSQKVTFLICGKGWPRILRKYWQTVIVNDCRYCRWCLKSWASLDITKLALI